jgi:hypothetical protein
MFDRITVLILAAVGGLTSCAQPRSEECAVITRDRAIRIADTAKRGMLSRSADAVEANFAESAARVEALNDGRGYGAQVAYVGQDGRTFVALIHEDCYVGWTTIEADPPN